MGKNKKWTIEEKIKIVEEFKSGKTISYLSKKYNIPSLGTISAWNKRYDENTLENKKRGRKAQDIEDVEILKKSYALLMKIRSQQNKLKDTK